MLKSFFVNLYDSLTYDGGEHFCLKNLRMYSGMQETPVIIATFSIKSFVVMNSQSVEMKINLENWAQTTDSHDITKILFKDEQRDDVDS